MKIMRDANSLPCQYFHGGIKNNTDACLIGQENVRGAQISHEESLSL